MAGEEAVLVILHGIDVEVGLRNKIQYMTLSLVPISSLIMVMFIRIGLAPLDTVQEVSLLGLLSTCIPTCFEQPF